MIGSRGMLLFRKVARKLRQPKHYKATYSQCGEDVIVKFIFDELGILKPSYIDIGAHDPYYLSNTALFYEMGSTGINIEPDPTLFTRLAQVRQRDVNLNIGIADAPDEVNFYVMSVPTLNTFSKEQAEGYKREGDYQIRTVQRVKLDTITSVVNTHCSGRFPDFLNLDAEGTDRVILHSINYAVSAPTVICVETISFSNSGRGIKDTDIAPFLETQGYMQYADTYINTIFVKKDKWG